VIPIPAKKAGRSTPLKEPSEQEPRAMADPVDNFILQSRRYLSAEYLPRIRACVERLDQSALWWRPNEASNSVGNLLLHLAGNVHQWITVSLGHRDGERDRPSEFAARSSDPGRSLIAQLEVVVREADEVLAGLDRGRLGDRLTIQGRDVTILEAVYHVVEHFASHTGQIVYITKQLTGEDLGFYRVTGDVVHRSRSAGAAAGGERGAQDE
jgi:uncharacterized damage-inducible protein DinB